jgi:hypothetical protein
LGVSGLSVSLENETTDYTEKERQKIKVRKVKHEDAADFDWGCGTGGPEAATYLFIPAINKRKEGGATL